MGGVGDWGVGYNGVGRVCDWSGIIKTPTPTPPPHSHTTTPYPPLPHHDFHSISRAPLPTLTPHSVGQRSTIAHSAWRQRNCAHSVSHYYPHQSQERGGYGVVPLQTRSLFNVSQGRGGAVFPSFSDTRRRERFQRPWKRGVWKGRDVQGEARLALSRHSIQHGPGEDAASAERAAGARPSR